MRENVKKKKSIQNYPLEMTLLGQLGKNKRRNSTNETSKKKRHIGWCLEKQISKLPTFSSGEMQEHVGSIFTQQYSLRLKVQGFSQVGYRGTIMISHNH